MILIWMVNPDVDPATGLLEIVQYNGKKAATVSNLVQQIWLCRYTRPTIITYNSRNEFLGNSFKNNLIKKKYGIKAKCVTTENPQAGSILEKNHRVMVNLVCTLDLHKNYMDKNNLWSGILEVIAFVVRRPYHTNYQSMPGKLVFVHDMILNTPFIPG